MNIRIRKRATAAMVAMCILAGLLSITITNLAADGLADPYGGTPQCTNAIADAGGICHGEPR